MDELRAFLAARLDEDEMSAAAAAKGPWTWIAMRGYPQRITNPEAVVIAETYTNPDAPAYEAEHIIRHHPARVLAEVEAKRQIIQRYEEQEIFEPREELAHALRWLALPYADHPDYREEWRP